VDKKGVLYMGKLILKSRLLTVPLLFCVCFFAFATLAIADEPPAATSTLERLVVKWVELRRALTEEAESWEEQRAQLEQERVLLLKAKETLEQEIAAAGEEQRSAETERARLLAHKEGLEKSLNACLPALRQAEADLRGWRSLWPSSLLTPPLRKAFDQLQKTSEQSVTRRLQVILSLYGEIERLQYGVHVVKEVLKTDASRSREMDVIYLGLAQGFAVSVDNQMAGIGRPTANDWKWEWRPEIAAEVRKAIAFYRHEKTADFVHLPLRVGEVIQE
jgi:hypothetical protein